MLLQGLWVASILSLILRPLSFFRVSSQILPTETERKDARIVVSQAIKRLHEVFHIGDLPQKLIHHRTPPQFMVDLFNAVADSNGITRDPKILEGNVVRSFQDRVHYDRTFHFFNVSSFGKNEKMIKAEFRMFRRKQTILSRNLLGHHFYKVSKWIHNSNANNGILAVTSLPSGNLLEYVLPALKRSKLDEKNAYLVIFSDDGRKMSKTDSELSQGSRKSPVTDAAVTLMKTENPVPITRGNKSRRTRAAPYDSNRHPITCQRVPLYVDFEKIGWTGWIISPRGYNAYHCIGSCPFPLGESLRATNHATVQSIVNALKLSKEVETPCCVPDKLQSISLLYFDDEENVVLKQYDDMVALSCGCH
ncbi:bone morphogenetic protein 2-like isoform X2 [Anguilla anguilla]|uniref:bone morphogenetic protein 2-like isoform X2 n=1 Tax=Anguilla anguilla TaxID=7936 RepID=UPI0015AB2497|nr:bone morphogenetic protein 2-like isoform X2 [Anguilla anguilla]